MKTIDIPNVVIKHVKTTTGIEDEHGKKSLGLEFCEDLRDFIELLENKDQLVRVFEEVDPELEINAILDRLARTGGPAVVFERVKGHKVPVLGNVFGSWQRVSWAFGVEDFEAIVDERIRRALTSTSEEDEEKVLAELKASFYYGPMAEKMMMLKGFLPYRPKEIPEAPFMEQVYPEKEVDLDALPLIKLWPQDGGRYITFPLIISRDPENGQLNVGIYRMMQLSKNRLCMHWLPQKHGAAHWRKAEKMGQPLPVAVAIGCDPALEVCGGFDLKPPVDEFLMAGLLKGARVTVTRGPLTGLPIPTGAEIVLEGYILPNERAMEGPFGEFHGYYSPPKETPIMEVKRISMRHRAYWHAATTGLPVTEIHVLAKAMERVGMAFMRIMRPEITDINMTVEGASLYTMIIGLKKTHPHQAREVIERIWKGAGQNSMITNIIVVDDDIDVHNLSRVLWAFSMHVRPDRDLIVSPSIKQDLEHPGLSPRGEGARLGIDATRKLPEEGYERERPGLVEMDPEVVRRVEERWGKFGLPSLNSRK